VFLAVVLEAVIAMPDAGIEIKATFIVAVSSGLSAIKTMILDFIKRKRLEHDGEDA
jgi:ribonuclease PH